jgi:hypothetical protein
MSRTMVERGLGMVRTDIEDNRHHQMHQNIENDPQYQCELCH